MSCELFAYLFVAWGCLLNVLIICLFALLTLIYLFWSDSEIIDLITPPASPPEPPVDSFVQLKEMPSDLSSPEGECFQHTTTVIRSRLMKATTTKLQQFDSHPADTTKTQNKNVEVKKRRKFEGHGWSKKGSKSSRRKKPLKTVPHVTIPVAVPIVDADYVPVPSYYFTTRRIGPAPEIYASRSSEIRLPQQLGVTLAQFVDWIVAGATFDHVSESQCDCPHCPYSTGEGSLQRALCLQRLVELHNSFNSLNSVD